MTRFKGLNTKSAEILSALIIAAISVGMFTSPESGLVVQTLKSLSMLPEWAILGLASSALCIVSCLSNSERLNAAARFFSGAMWGTIVLVFANAQHWLPLFWIAAVMFAFDFYLVTVKGRSWSRSNS